MTKMDESALEKQVENSMKNTKLGEVPSTTYRWRNDVGQKMHITCGVDEFGVLNSMIINVGASGRQEHNVCNALGRVISLCIQNDKATLLQIVETLEDFSSEVVWMSNTLGRAKSIPAVIALILERHLKIEEAIEGLHTGQEVD